MKLVLGFCSVLHPSPGGGKTESFVFEIEIHNFCNCLHGYRLLFCHASYLWISTCCWQNSYHWQDYKDNLPLWGVCVWERESCSLGNLVGSEVFSLVRMEICTWENLRLALHLHLQQLAGALHYKVLAYIIMVFSRSVGLSEIFSSILSDQKINIVCLWKYYYYWVLFVPLNYLSVFSVKSIYSIFLIAVKYDLNL